MLQQIFLLSLPWSSYYFVLISWIKEDDEGGLGTNMSLSSNPQSSLTQLQ